jgi:hypothetical protein
MIRSTLPGGSILNFRHRDSNAARSPSSVSQHHRTDLRGQPLDQRILIRPSRLPKPQSFPDLRPVPLDRPADQS